MKKNYSIRLLSAAAIIAVGGGMLTSCGTQAPVDMTADTRGTTITFWTGFGSAVTTSLETVLKEFTAKTGINVSHEGKGGYDGLQTAINLSASTTTYPNVAIGYPDHFAGYVDSNIILRLDSFINSDSQIPAKQADGFEELPKLDINDFYSDYMTENKTIEFDEKGNGYTLGLPFNKSTEVMVYNKTFFENSVVKAAGIAIPTTWDEVKDQDLKILKFVKDKGAYKKVLGTDGIVYDSTTALPTGAKVLLDFSSVNEGDFHPLSYDSQANFFITGVRQWGGTYTEVDKATRKGYIKFKSQETYDSLSKFNEIYQAGGLAIPATFGEASYCSNHFKIYKSLMNIGSSAGVSNCVPAGDAFEIACAPIPYAAADKKYVISQGTNLCMFDTGTAVQKLASWKLIKYLSQYNNGEFAALTGYFPTCKSAYNSTVYQEFMNATTGSSVDKINRSAAAVNGNTYSVAENKWIKFVDPGFNGSSTIRTSIGLVTGQVFIDKKTPEDVVAAKYAELKDYVAA
jgi:multiple sugar transport system substrate-binding protein